MVNVRAVMRLTHAVLGPMLERNRIHPERVVGRPSPRRCRPHLRGQQGWSPRSRRSCASRSPAAGPRVALTPGLVPTGFQDRAGVQAHVPGALWLDPDDVVDTA